ncbi:MAG: SPOR domain-containing protein [Candidatus Cohnella colombiensis]|uniref:SPOR domain-containing protein n=1 Tax=Candidatus Cohnella colombiensis TaxID=3121368 RepID=A0AA95EYP0_9BACL|nr:MAG: SPOR domain-containing protein [Cohnella sp.]
MSQKARMTFRFEPPQPTHTPQPTNTTKLNPSTNVLEKSPTQLTSQPSMNQPPVVYQDEIQALEEMIRQSDSNKHTNVVLLHPKQQVVNQHNQAEFRQVIDLEQMTVDLQQSEKWIVPNSEPQSHEDASDWHIEDIESEVRSHRANDQPSWSRVMLTVTAAVATGALFGYLLLSIFTGEPMFPNRNSTIQDSQKQATNDQTSIEDNNATISALDPLDSSASAVSSLTTTLDLAEEPSYMLQYGVFSNEDSMKNAVAQLQEKGMSYAIDRSDGNRIYVGIASTRDEAELLSEQLSNVEVYIKPIDAPAVDQVVTQAGFADWIHSSASLSRLIIQFTLTNLQAVQPQTMSADTQKAFQQVTKEWDEQSTVIAQMSSPSKALASNYYQALLAASTALEQYNMKPTYSQLWAIQSALIEAQFANIKLRSSLQTESNT